VGPAFRSVAGDRARLRRRDGEVRTT
jgi:hypothetical protein